VRKALNENPRVQLAVFGAFGVILVIVLLTMMGGNGGEEAVPSATPGAELGSSAAAEAPVPDPAPATSAPAPAAPSTPDPAPSPAAPGTDSSGGLLPTKGLPEDLLVAYARGKAIALVVVDPKAISDKQVNAWAQRLGGRGDVEVFTVKAKNIARYSRITRGVAVGQTPALVVIRPRTKAAGVPVASVSYGFRSPKSIDVAVEDALYSGDQRTVAPD
jgi:hypothetical protein